MYQKIEQGIGWRCCWRAVEIYMPLWTKREVGVWDFKEKAGNLQVHEKEQTCGK